MVKMTRILKEVYSFMPSEGERVIDTHRSIKIGAYELGLPHGTLDQGVRVSDIYHTPLGHLVSLNKDSLINFKGYTNAQLIKWGKVIVTRRTTGARRVYASLREAWKTGIFNCVHSTLLAHLGIYGSKYPTFKLEFVVGNMVPAVLKPVCCCERSGEGTSKRIKLNNSPVNHKVLNLLTGEISYPANERTVKKLTGRSETAIKMAIKRESNFLKPYYRVTTDIDKVLHRTVTTEEMAIAGGLCAISYFNFRGGRVQIIIGPLGFTYFKRKLRDVNPAIPMKVTDNIADVIRGVRAIGFDIGFVIDGHVYREYNGEVVMDEPIDIIVPSPEDN